MDRKTHQRGRIEKTPARSCDLRVLAVRTSGSVSRRRTRVSAAGSVQISEEDGVRYLHLGSDTIQSGMRIERTRRAGAVLYPQHAGVPACSCPSRSASSTSAWAAARSTKWIYQHLPRRRAGGAGAQPARDRRALASTSTCRPTTGACASSRPMGRMGGCATQGLRGCRSGGRLRRRDAGGRAGSVEFYARRGAGAARQRRAGGEPVGQRPSLRRLSAADRGRLRRSGLLPARGAARQHHRAGVQAQAAGNPLGRVARAGVAGWRRPMAWSSRDSSEALKRLNPHTRDDGSLI